MGRSRKYANGCDDEEDDDGNEGATGVADEDGGYASICCLSCKCEQSITVDSKPSPAKNYGKLI